MAEVVREDAPVKAEVNGRVAHSLDPIVQRRLRQFLVVHHGMVLGDALIHVEA